MLTKVKHITRAMLRAEPDTLFVFGDNMQRAGFGGQAREMRGEPNAIGIPTKKAPSMLYWAFFTDDDYARAEIEITTAYLQLKRHADRGGKIVWPADGIGTGMAELPKRAPRIWELIERYRHILDASEENR